MRAWPRFFAAPETAFPRFRLTRRRWRRFHFSFIQYARLLTRMVRFVRGHSGGEYGEPYGGSSDGGRVSRQVSHARFRPLGYVYASLLLRCRLCDVNLHQVVFTSVVTARVMAGYKFLHVCM